MIVTKIELKNWRNFRNLEFSLRERMYVIGPNASGKSNLLDVFCFLRDVAMPAGGGLQKAVADRGGMKKLRCLAARRDPEISIQIWLSDTSGADLPSWKYELAFKSEGKGRQRVMVSRERVEHKGSMILERPTKEDDEDNDRLTQTAIEQINSNAEFRSVANHFSEIVYLHLVPQLLKFSEVIGGNRLENDPFGQGFMERLARAPEKTRKSRLKKIESALQAAVPQLTELQFKKDAATGKPHLEARYEHWRPNAGWQREDQFSDGTLRLIALLWSLLEGDSLLLLEEPELSLNDAIVEKIPALLASVQRKTKQSRQVIISTHSRALLDDRGIDARSVVVLDPNPEGTSVQSLTESDFVQLNAGFTVADVLLPKSRVDLRQKQLNLL